MRSRLGLSLLGRMSRDILGFYRDVQREYGDVVYMRLGQHHEYAVFHPAQIHELLVMKARSFIRMEHPIAVIRQWNGDSVLVAEGDRWLRYRRLLQPSFAQQLFARYADEVAAATAMAIEGIADERMPLDFERTMTDLTTAVICRTMFGTDLGK